MAVVTAKMIKSAKAVNVVGYAQQLLRWQHQMESVVRAFSSIAEAMIVSIAIAVEDIVSSL